MVDTHTTNYKTLMHILRDKLVALDYGQELELNSRLTIAKHTDSEDFGIFRTHDWEHLVTFTLKRRDFIPLQGDNPVQIGICLFSFRYFQSLFFWRI